MVDLQKYIVDVLAISKLATFLLKLGHCLIKDKASAFRKGTVCHLVLCHMGRSSRCKNEDVSISKVWYHCHLLEASLHGLHRIDA